MDRRYIVPDAPKGDDAVADPLARHDLQAVENIFADPDRVHQHGPESGQIAHQTDSKDMALHPFHLPEQCPDIAGLFGNRDTSDLFYSLGEGQGVMDIAEPADPLCQEEILVVIAPLHKLDDTPVVKPEFEIGIPDDLVFNGHLQVIALDQGRMVRPVRNHGQLLGEDVIVRRVSRGAGIDSLAPGVLLLAGTGMHVLPVEGQPEMPGIRMVFYLYPQKLDHLPLRPVRLGRDRRHGLDDRFFPVYKRPECQVPAGNFIIEREIIVYPDPGDSHIDPGGVQHPCPPVQER